MIIVADSNIACIDDALAGHDAEVRLFRSDGKQDLRKLLKDADCLLCRSTIRVDEALLAESAVRFVATATSGTDHFDTDYLDGQGIVHASAAGSNARSVAEYVFHALFSLEKNGDYSLDGKTLGIIGVGHVGSQVMEIAERFGMHTILCDPPRYDREDDPRFRPMQEVLEQADIVTLHVPLTKCGAYPTAGMIDSSAIDTMKPGSVLMNAARGGVVDEEALRNAIARKHLHAVVLDVFAGEPNIDPATVIGATLATPHIAGHSYDGKLLGTQMVYNALCTFLGWTTAWDYQHALPAGQTVEVGFDIQGRERRILHSILTRVYDIQIDHAALLAAVQERDLKRPAAFKKLRSQYRIRRECAAYTIRLHDPESPLAENLRAMGCGVEAL